MIKQESLALWQGCLRGEQRAQKNLYDLFSHSLYLICLRYARDHQEAKDMLQEGFVKIFQDLHQFDADKGSLYTWMRRVSINACLQYLRKNRNDHWESLPKEELDPGYSETIMEADESQTRRLLAYLQKLPEGYRIVFNLHVMEGYTHQEIAEWLGISPNTSKSQLFKAKSMLRKWVNRQAKSIAGTKMALEK